MALPRLVTLTDVARQLGVDRETIRQAIRRGELHPIRLNNGRWLRFKYDEIEDWIARSNHEPTPPRAA